MSEQEKTGTEATFDQLMDHEYDGIREYDNPLPSWWVGIFVLSIFFAAGYWVYYHAGGHGPSVHQVYAEDLKDLQRLQDVVEARSIKADEKTLAALAANPRTKELMTPVFHKLCATCHKTTGVGLIGPNLTDDHQKHGKTRMAIYKTIRDGVKGKGMQSWKKQLKPVELARMAAYVATLRGTHVAGGKKPEGEKIPPYPTFSAEPAKPAAPAKAAPKKSAPAPSPKKGATAAPKKG